jgi:hypothetical protein
MMLGLHSCFPINDKPFEDNAEQKDYLIYQIYDYPKNPQLFFYDSSNNMSVQILDDWDISIYGFAIGSNNRLAFSSLSHENNAVYIVNYPFTDNIPTSITSDISINYIPISWSPDGNYLLLKSIETERNNLLLWDGDRFLDIYKYNGDIQEATWSLKGQLAFTEFFINEPSNDRSEVYVWDGNALINVSQNPSGDDRFPAWSEDGQLAFLSNRNEFYDIYVWDGVSKSNGLPDIKSFKNIAPDLTQYFSNPTWSSNNSLSFSGGNESHAQIYEWDGQTAKNISQNPSFHNGGQTWRNDGFWSFTTHFAQGQNLYIRDNFNQTVLETKGQYSPAWSQNGLLVFCVPDRPNYILSIWDGDNTSEIATGRVIVAQWNNGENVYCSD